MQLAADDSLAVAVVAAIRCGIACVKLVLGRQPTLVRAAVSHAGSA